METAREAIILAAMKGVRLHGLHGVRIRHISDIAGVLPSSIYGYFNGKEDLMQACFSHVSDCVAQMISLACSAAEELDAAERKKSFWNCLFRWFLQHPDETMFFYRYCDRPDLTEHVILTSSSYGVYCDAIKRLPAMEKLEPLLSWVHVLLGTARYAGYVSLGILPETETCYSQIYSCIFGA